MCLWCGVCGVWCVVCVVCVVCGVGVVWVWCVWCAFQSAMFQLRLCRRTPQVQHWGTTRKLGSSLGHPRDTRTPTGHHRKHHWDTAGTSPGHRQDTAGTPPGHHRDTAGTPPGHRGHGSGPNRDTTGTPRARIWPEIKAGVPAPVLQSPYC